MLRSPLRSVPTRFAALTLMATMATVGLGGGRAHADDGAVCVGPLTVTAAGQGVTVPHVCAP